MAAAGGARAATAGILSWQQLGARAAAYKRDNANGPTNCQSTLRLFGKDEAAASRLTLYRDNHGWCPYCQKIWLWLEEKQVPYRVRKVTMFCYGEKEAWYKAKVPSGMLPAIELDGRIITESDVILESLEEAFGPLVKSMRDPEVVPLRKLERVLFSSWCRWLCYPQRSEREERSNGDNFEKAVGYVESALGHSGGPFFLGSEISVADCVFTPYVERMAASLYYYKGYTLRDSTTHPGLSRWFDAMETRSTYRGTQSDYHTHVHDLPPQMGGCYENGSRLQQQLKMKVDHGPWDEALPDVGFGEPEDAAIEAVARTVKHHENLIRANPVKAEVADVALRCALTRLLGEHAELEALPLPPLPRDSDVALRYVRDRVNVPRDMSIWAARRLRTSIEATAATCGDGQGPPIATRNRHDQNPREFQPRI